VTAATEHAAVLATARALQARGVTLRIVDVDETGHVDPDRLRRALEPGAELVSLMAANNEVGTLHDLDVLAALAAERGALVHTDAAQAAGRVRLSVRESAIDLLSLTAHKIHGPKGVGALWIRRGVEGRVRPRLRGGAQERGLRAGTLNVPLIVGFGAAAEILQREGEEEASRLERLRERLRAAIAAAVDGVVLNGDPSRRLPNHLSLAFRGIDGDALLTALPDVAASTGSACRAGSGSHVLEAMGFSRDRIRGTVRFGVGRFTSEAEVDRAAARITAAITRLRRTAGNLGVR
jgi:cysteine desulfurase